MGAAAEKAKRGTGRRGNEAMLTHRLGGGDRSLDPQSRIRDKRQISRGTFDRLPNATAGSTTSALSDKDFHVRAVEHAQHTKNPASHRNGERGSTQNDVASLAASARTIRRTSVWPARFPTVQGRRAQRRQAPECHCRRILLVLRFQRMLQLEAHVEVILDRAGIFASIPPLIA